MAQTDTSNLKVIGIDIGKDVFHHIGFDNDGRLVLRKKIKRLALVSTFEKFPRCIIGMETCLSAHFVSRSLWKVGFETRITGNIHTRTFLVQAAHVLLIRPHNWHKFSFGKWLKKASQHLHKNKLAVALANKLARIA